ncbi:MAG: hypothetical protein WCP93_01060 [Candidatus Berkelbacteria bacterium]
MHNQNDTFIPWTEMTSDLKDSVRRVSDVRIQSKIPLNHLKVLQATMEIMVIVPEGTPISEQLHSEFIEAAKPFKVCVESRG